MKNYGRVIHGGVEGNRTPVQKQATPGVYMLRRHC